MIQVTHLTKIYGNNESRFYALRDINFSIPNGDSVAIIGKSGSGKSTLMHLISGLDSPTEGSITIDGNTLSSMKAKDIYGFRNKHIGFIFQTFYIQPNETCVDNVMLPLEIAGEPLHTRKQKAIEALQSVGLGDKITQKATALSGGQKQRLCIARALITSPSYLLADEPTGNLDSENGKHIMDLLFALNKEGKTLIIVTHDPDIAALCHTRIHIADGVITSTELS